MAKLTFTLELDMDFIPSDDIQENIVWNIARILKDGGTNSGLVSAKFYPEDDDETDRVVPFIDKLTVTGPAAATGMFPVAGADLTNAF